MNQPTLNFKVWKGRKALICSWQTANNPKLKLENGILTGATSEHPGTIVNDACAGINYRQLPVYLKLAFWFCCLIIFPYLINYIYIFLGETLKHLIILGSFAYWYSLEYTDVRIELPLDNDIVIGSDYGNYDCYKDKSKN